MSRRTILVFTCCVAVITLTMVAACTDVTKPATIPKGKQSPVTDTTAIQSNRTTGVQTQPVFFGKDAPESAVTPLLCRPTDRSITISLLTHQDLVLFIEYRNSTGTTTLRTPEVAVKTGAPVNTVITPLQPDTGYIYRLGYHKPGNATVQYSPEYAFHTKRSAGSGFVFNVQSDSHLDERTNGDLYNQTLKNELDDRPDFLIDLGDTFMTEKLPVKNSETYLSRYLAQRSYFETVGNSVPVFLALGNHDGEAGYAMDGTAKNIAVQSLSFRKMYFPNPEPDGFYTGNSEKTGLTGLKQDYYAWVWGDALFIVIDPYWYTMTKAGGKTDGWAWTLGESQYRWLKETLETSDVKYKFIFAHQLVGGDPQGRGGTEYASLYEWGGKNPDGSWGFDQHRPGWEVPIHQMLVENNVTAFFHGHDHIFAKQELDGVVYQDVPQPATMGSGKGNPGAEYGYINGVMLASPGYLRITVSPESAQVAYIRTSTAGDRTREGNTNGVAYSYTLLLKEGS